MHNFLQCHVKNCAQSYPLDLTVTEWAQDTPEPQYDRSTFARLLPKVEWASLLKVVRSLDLPEASCLPEEKPEDDASDQVIANTMMALLGRQVRQGRMTCPGCGHVYPINDSIPNMLLNENEI